MTARRAAIACLLAALSWAAAGAGGGGACDPIGAAGREAAYHLVPDGEGRWAGVNEGQRLRLAFTAEGVRVAPLEDAPCSSATDEALRRRAPGGAHPGWEWALSQSRAGPPQDLRPVSGGWPLVTGDRIDLLRGPLTEWFVNSRKGLQHGLTLSASEDPGLAHFDFALRGGLTPKVREDGQAIDFTDAAGSAVLRYRDLRGVDAEGRDVAVRWERLEGSTTDGSVPRPAGADGGSAGSRLVVEGAEHAYPISVMGLLVSAKGAAQSAEPLARNAGAPAAIQSEASAESTLGTVGALSLPTNDLCAGAEVIPGTGPFPYLTAAYDVTDAATAGDPSVPSCQANLSRSIWFRFTPATSGSYDLSLCAEAPTATTLDDTVLAVYTASADCSGFGEVNGACDDDSCAAGDLQSVIGNLDLAAGTTYFIVAWKYGSTAPPAGASAVQLQIVLNLPPGPAPANDRCGGAEVIPGAGPFPYLTSLIADVSGATATGDPPGPSCQPNVSRSVWYSFTPATSGRYTFSTCADAPTGSTLDDTVMAVYSGTGPCAGLSELSGACDDDSCLREAGQSVIRGVSLTVGTLYSIVVWKYDIAPPAAGNAAIQMRVSQEVAPANDTCGGATGLLLDRPLAGSTANSRDDYRLDAASACFAGIGQTSSTAAGGDVVYTFSAPADGRYSFRVTGYEMAKDAVLYVASDCPAGSPVTVSACLGAANRNVGYPGEEVACLPLQAGQQVYVYVDESSPSPGSPFTLEVNACRTEAEPNGAPAAAGQPACGIEGSIGAAGDADFFSLGAPAAGSRVFAMVDGAAANSTDFDLRVTTNTDTLEYDDLNNDTPFGSVAPNVAGTPLTGAASFLRVSHYSPAAQAEPYRLYAAVQPPSVSATSEVEPNDATAAATAGANTYYAGALSDPNDVDIFSFSAGAADLVLIGLDLDPTRNGTPFNGSLALLDAAGATVVLVNDGGSTSSTTPGAGTLEATTPRSPAEAIAWRARATGTYYLRVAASNGGAGDYLLSIARNCALSGPDADGDGVPDASDCAPEDPSAWSAPGEATALVLTGSPDQTALRWSAPASPGGAVVLYDVLRGAAAGDFSAPVCVAKEVTATTATDSTIPSRVLYYLVRAKNSCGTNLGVRSDGAPRVAGACP